METLLDKHKAQKDALDDLYKRMDADRDLLYLKKYVLQDSAGKPVPDIINVTLNKPAIFAANIISALNKTSQQTVVESSDPEVDTSEIEEFQNALFNMADDRLHRMGQASLNSFVDTQLCIRGRSARRVLFINGKPHITSWDARYMTYEMGEDDLLWGGYEMRRGRGRILSEYNVDISPSKMGKVIDLWDDKVNEVYLDDKLIKQEEHKLGHCPLILEIVPLGYGNIMMDEEKLSHEGESIFFLVRDIIPELNRLVSILQTLNMKAVKPPMKHKSKEGKLATPPGYDEATSMGAMTSIDAEGDIEPINYGDAKRSAEMVYGMMEKAMQEGSITSVDLGNLQFPLSAVALVEIGEGRDQVYLPRLQTKAWLNQRTVEMLTKQVLAQGRDVELGIPGHSRKFQLKDLRGEYQTSYRYFVKSPKTDIARMSVAQAASNYFDIETILEDVLQVEDPKGIMRKRYYYLAETIDPNILTHRIIMNMLDMAEQGDDNAAREAEIMALSLGMSLEQVKSGQIPEKTPMQKTSPETVLPLLEEGENIRGMRPGKRAVEEIKTPQEAVGG